ncbi:MAG: hypothetical protein JNL30_03950 [Rubrivivax sp.]|nr:hypothetical protein [Rubrivivax sp.]
MNSTILRVACTGLGVVTALAASLAQAQDGGLSLSVGARAWYTEWTTFGYYPGADPNLALTQTSGPSKWVTLPTVSLRFGNFFGSLSAFPSTGFEFTDGSASKRSESDLNVGYAVLPGLSVTLGYKRIAQRGEVFRYEPKGPVLGVSGNAALSGPVSLYGALGVGRLKTPGDPRPEVVKFDATYRLTEVGVAYALPSADGALVRRWTFTAGHRIQVMRSKDAFTTAAGRSQDGIDTTQGFTLGVLATF